MTGGGRYLSTRFSTALVAAAELHAGQRRKRRDRHVPYVSHLLAVAALVLEDGGDEDQAIAGLLHDAIEDQGVTGERIAAQFGAEVARIVVACSDSGGDADRAGGRAGAGPKPPWLPRKVDHLARLANADEAVLRVVAADKLHNCRDLVVEVEDAGPAVFGAFRGGPEGTCWYYGEVDGILRARLPTSRLTPQLGVAARRLHELVGLPYPAPPPT